MALELSGSINISGSMTATTIVVSSPGVAGMVSSSAQITELAPLMAYTASLKAAAIVSSSQQVQNYFTFAKTGSVNTFYGNQTFSSSLLVSGTIAVGTDDSGYGRILFDAATNKLRIQSSKNGTDCTPISFWSQRTGGTFAESMIISGSIVQIGSNTTDASLTLSGDNSGGDTFINFKSDIGQTKVQLLGTKNGGTGGRLTIKTLQSSVLTDAVVVENNNVGIGIVPIAKFFVNLAANQNIRFSQEGGQATVSAVNDLANTYAHLNLDGNVVRIQSNSSGNTSIGTATDFGYKLNLNGQPGANGYTAWTNWSDSRLKENITDLVVTNVLDKICAIRPVTYNYNELSGFDEATRARRISGFIAQELMEVLPDMVGTIKRDGVDYYDTNLSNLNLYLVKAIQELSAKNNALVQRIEYLENK